MVFKKYPNLRFIAVVLKRQKLLVFGNIFVVNLFVSLNSPCVYNLVPKYKSIYNKFNNNLVVKTSVLDFSGVSYERLDCLK